MLQKMLVSGLLALAMIVTGCGGDDDAPDPGSGLTPPGGCTVADEKQSVHEIMTSVYYWYDQVPDVSPEDYASKEALLDVLIQPEKDIGKEYSYLTTVEAEDAFLSNAAYIGFGFSMARDTSGRVFLRETFEGGPAREAGMQRGDEISAIDGAPVASMSAAQLDEALGPDEAGYSVAFTVRHPGASSEATVEIAKAEVHSTVVGEVVHNLGADEDTTYIFFRSFVDPAFDQLNDAFAAMKAVGDTQLVLDLRYNGGGLVSVAGHLGGLIAGHDHEGEILAKLEFNDQYQSENQEYLVSLLADSVDVTDVVVITTPATASASEMIINGLAPFSDTVNVATVGSTSYGKPVGQSRLEFCETEILRAVTFKVVNANDLGEYYLGIDPVCPAEDDISNPFGDPAEASLNGALYYLENGACDATASMKAMRAHAKRMAVQPEGDPLVRDGWDVLTGGAR